MPLKKGIVFDLSRAVRIARFLKQNWLLVGIVLCSATINLGYVAVHANDPWIRGTYFSQLDLAHCLLHGKPVFVRGSLFDWDAYWASPGRPFSAYVIGFNAYARYVNELPGYSFIAALVWSVAGSETVLSLQLFQFLLDTFALLLVYYIGSRLFSRQVALLASAFYMLAPLIVESLNWIVPQYVIGTVQYFTFQPYRDFYPLYGSIALVALLVRMKTGNFNPSRRLKLYILFGLVFAASVWARQTIIFLPIFLAIYLLRKYGYREAFKMLFIAYLILLVTLTPWIARNHKIYGQFIPISAGTGHWWYIGFGEISNPWNITYADWEGSNKAAELIEERHLNPNDPNLRYSQPGYQRLLTDEVFRMIQETPGFYLGLLTLRTVSGLTLGMLTPRMLQSMITGQVLYLGDLLRVLALAFASVVGVWMIYESLKRKKARSSMLLLMLVPASFMFSFLLFQMQFRYMWPCSWSYMILAAFGIETIWLKIRNRQGS